MGAGGGAQLSVGGGGGKEEKATEAPPSVSHLRKPNLAGQGSPVATEKLIEGSWWIFQWGSTQKQPMSRTTSERESSDYSPLHPTGLL